MFLSGLPHAQFKGLFVVGVIRRVIVWWLISLYSNPHRSRSFLSYVCLNLRVSDDCRIWFSAPLKQCSSNLFMVPLSSAVFSNHFRSNTVIVKGNLQKSWFFWQLCRSVALGLFVQHSSCGLVLDYVVIVCQCSLTFHLSAVNGITNHSSLGFWLINTQYLTLGVNVHIANQFEAWAAVPYDTWQTLICVLCPYFCNINILILRRISINSF